MSDPQCFTNNKPLLEMTAQESEQFIDDLAKFVNAGGQAILGGDYCAFCGVKLQPYIERCLPIKSGERVGVVISACRKHHAMVEFWHSLNGKTH